MHVMDPAAGGGTLHWAHGIWRAITLLCSQHDMIDRFCLHDHEAAPSMPLLQGHVQCLQLTVHGRLHLECLPHSYGAYIIRHNFLPSVVE